MDSVLLCRVFRILSNVKLYTTGYLPLCGNRFWLEWFRYIRFKVEWGEMWLLIFNLKSKPFIINNCYHLLNFLIFFSYLIFKTYLIYILDFRLSSTWLTAVWSCWANPFKNWFSANFEYQNSRYVTRNCFCFCLVLLFYFSLY